VKLIVDTHAFLWATTDDARLSPRARALIQSGDSDLLLSVVSAYELVFKATQGRIRLPADPATWLNARMRSFALRWLPVTGEHAIAAAALPRIHGDPWDRVLVAQARLEGIPILTADRGIARYEVETIW
jgi:PIN domain nuclease of toxin-antitoxin system